MYLLSSTGLSAEISIIIIDIALILFVGLVLGRLAESVKIPAVTGYLVAGLIIGPVSALILGDPLVDAESIEDYHIISNIALGFIAFQVGNELWLGKLKKTGKRIVIITIIQAVATTGTVILLLLLFKTDLPVSLVLGAVAAATAPAPIMMIVKKYRTKGDLTDTILPVVGLDDAVGVIMFGVLLSVSVSIAQASGEAITFWELIKEPLIEIGYSILIGSFVGAATGVALKTIDHNHERNEKNLNVVIIAVFITTGLAMYFGGSPILTPMIAGAVVTNLINKECYQTEERTIVQFIPPLMIAFFTIAGAELKFDVLATVGLVGVGYIVGRILGKYFGSMIGCKTTYCPTNVTKYLGLSLLPQSGVAIGLAIAAYEAFGSVGYHHYAEVIQNVTLGSVLFFELFGPFLVKMAFTKSNEIRLES
jgi:Kef-type K+ transport system membrane component KefB